MVAGSQYKRTNFVVVPPQIDAGARQLVDEILATGYSPDPVWVMDICRTTDGLYYLLEIGCFSFANLYSCDKDAVVRAVSSIAAKIHEIRHAEGNAAQLPRATQLRGLKRN